MCIAFAFAFAFAIRAVIAEFLPNSFELGEVEANTLLFLDAMNKISTQLKDSWSIALRKPLFKIFPDFHGGFCEHQTR